MNKLVKYIIGIAIAALIVFIVWYFGNIVAYILVAAVLAIMAQPLTDALCRLKIGRWNFPRWAAALIGLVAIWGVAILFFALFIPLISSKISALTKLDYQSIFSSLEEPMRQFGDFLQKYFAVDISEASLTEMFAAQVGRVVDIDAINNIFSSVFSVVGSVGIALFSISFIAFYFLKEKGLFLRMLLALFPNKYEENVTRAMGSVSKLLSRYFIGVFIESTAMLLMVAVVLMILGFRAEDAFFSGIAVGIFNVIPYLGPWIGFAISAVAGLTFSVAGMTTGSIFLSIGFTILGAQMIDNYLLQPLLYSRQVNAHPLEIFIVMLIAGSVAGILGMLIAIPAYTVLRVFAKEFFNNYKLVQKLTQNMDGASGKRPRQKSE